MQADIIESVVAYWSAQRDGRQMPTRRSIDPVEMADFLANLVLVEVIDDGRDYFHRIVGESAASLVGADLMGRKISEFKDAADLEPWRNGLDIARTFKAPHMAHLTACGADHGPLKIVFLPVARSETDSDAGFLLCAVAENFE